MRTTLKRGATRNGTANGAGVLPPVAFSPRTVYDKPRRSTLGFLGRVLFWLVVSVLVAAGGAAGGVWLYGEQSTAETAPDTPEERAAQAFLEQVPPPDKPAVALVIGYDRRGAGPDKGNEARSDTIMLVRADPGRKTISMLSFPRDLLVELAGCKNHPPRLAKINEAFTDCGTRGTLQTVKKLTGIPINYFITVDFAAFVKVVNDLGGVYVDVDRRYFNDNSSGGERYAAIDLHAGYQKLFGRDALSFVRYRHTDSDLYRNARQQEFVKAVKQQVSGLGALWELRGVVNTVTSHVKIGVGGGAPLQFDTVLAYAKLAYELPSGNLFQVRLAPERLGENSFFQLIASDDEIDRIVDEFMSPDPQAGDRAATVAVGGKPKARRPSAPAPEETNVEVLNGNGVAGAADEATYGLTQRGYQAVDGGNADTFEYFETLVLYDPARQRAKEAADAMAKLFGDAEVKAAAPADGLETMLRVIVGKTFQGTLGPAPRDTAPEREPAKVVKDPQHALAFLRRAQRRVGFPLLAPTVREAGSALSTLEPIRVYEVTPEEQAVRLVYNGPLGADYWGIQQTSWEDAPILEGPTVTRRIGGREYRLHFNGQKLHVVAFEERGAVYWVTNTLLDALSNETMLGIAKGLRPLRRR
jgi:LCP family protein required for cell wall assembly